MPKITLIGAGSTVFARKLLGDTLSFHAAVLDPHTAAELDLDQIW
jgi:alpha-galactosidase/6-phospho-beta-glucosidase family protein